MSTTDPPYSGDDRPTVMLIAGPTASGKSAMALDMAERRGGVIVNADASQVYRDLRIVTARPSAADEARAEHRLYGHVDAAVACSAARWAADARAVIVDVVAAGRLPILVGGTGLYLKTLIDGLAPIPPIDPEIRREVRALETATAYAALQREDAPVAGTLHPHDAARIQRALETIRATGTSIAAWRSRRAGGLGRDYRFVPTIVMPAPDETMMRCDTRVAAMMAGGAIAEVEALIARGLPDDLPAMRAIGVPQIIALMKGRKSFDETAESIRIATYRYAKRQRTWFRNQSMGIESDDRDRVFKG